MKIIQNNVYYSTTQAHQLIHITTYAFYSVIWLWMYYISSEHITVSTVKPGLLMFQLVQSLQLWPPMRSDRLFIPKLLSSDLFSSKLWNTCCKYNDILSDWTWFLAVTTTVYQTLMVTFCKTSAIADSNFITCKLSDRLYIRCSISTHVSTANDYSY